MFIKIISSLEKLYHGDKFPANELKCFSMLNNERKSFQVAVECENEFNANVNISSPIKAEVFSVEHIKSDFPMSSGADDYFRFSQDGFYPDLLMPVSDEFTFKKGINVIWVEVTADKSHIGENEITVEINGEVAKLTVEIIDKELNFNDFIYTCWFHTDCLMSHYGFEAFSEEYWRVVESFLKTAVQHGMSCVLTPIFTPPLDTEIGKERPTVQLVDVTVTNGEYSFGFDKLSRWIDMAKTCGIKYFEMAHLFTQWGAKSTPKIMAEVDGKYKRIFGWDTKSYSKEYKKFLTAFSFEFDKFIKSKSLKDNVFIHVSDEPDFNNLYSYGRASRLIKKLFKDYKIIDALSDPLFYKLGIIKNPIPASNHAHKFIGKVPNLWTYYCSSQKNNYVSNRFFCNESLRNRVLGYQLFKYDIKGFLHWGYNFYYTQYSKSVINPFEVSDAGEKFPSGDSYVVYPSQSGDALPSLRLKVFYDALQDMAALNTLALLTSKDECLKIIEDNSKIKITFSDYPHNNMWLLRTREEVNRKIKEIIK